MTKEYRKLFLIFVSKSTIPKNIMNKYLVNLFLTKKERQRTSVDFSAKIFFSKKIFIKNNAISSETVGN